ncbi:DUF5018 domain-containing protein [Ichthyobacterium seriolicida]|uniref:Pkd domain containing protein n=1 Tax=Ichthyobacterium seriolicida TaxID=242600 RepID=A0A1J1DXP4_9FLAO|nr:hypothetical protein [Ichthyobacterium seriolicida]BAV94634.1 pkd domain containing protein [Ichthyobacterium seriolicida]
MFKKNYFLKSIIFSFVLLSVIIFSCDKKNIIEDDLNICIESFSLLDSENAGKKLESNIDCQINAEEHTISLTVPHTAVLDGLKFNITPCEGTTISPASGEAVDFEAVVEEATNEDVSEGAAEETTKKPSSQRYKKVFTLTKEGKSQEYTVYITKVLASDCSISSFKLEKSKNETKIFADREGVITESTDTDPSTITLHVSESAILDDLTPTIIHTGTSFSSEDPVSTTSTDDLGASVTTTTVNYTVIAADGKTKVYAVKYIKDLSSDNRISVFSFTKDTNNTGLKLTRSSAGARASDVVISNNNTNTGTETVSVLVSTAATITALIPTIIKHKDATVSPSEGVHDYVTSKTYTITAQDGQTKEYTVSVTKNLSNDKEISSFKFENSVNTEKPLGQDYSAASIPAATGDADVTVNIAKIPHTVSDLNDLKPTIEFSANASVNPQNQTPQNFTRGTPVVYTVTAQDGTTRRYNVIIGTLSNVAEITSFKIEKDGTSIAPSITVDMMIVLDGVDDTTVKLNPEIVVSPGATVSPTSGTETQFTYGTAVPYTVTAENGSKKTYSVTVKSSNSKMKSFKFKADGANQSTGKIVQDVTGIIDHDAKTVTVKVPHDAVVTALTPEVLGNNGSKVTIKGQNTDANTEQNFSSDVIYTITAQNGSTSNYTVKVSKYDEPQITGFTFSNDSGNNLGTPVVEFNQGSEGEIIVKVPYNATLTGLVPTVTAATAAFETKIYKEESGTTPSTTSTDFSSSHTTAVKYSAVGPAGGRKVYNVKVYKEPAITGFKFEKSQNNSDGGFPTGKTYTAESSTITQGNLLQNGTISITVANTVNVTNLKATISGNNINPSTTTIDTSFTSTSGTSTYSATITVANQYLSDFTKTYTVNLTKEAAPKLTEFKITADESKGIKDEVTAELTHPSTDNTGTIKLKFPKRNQHEITLTGLSYTSAPVDGHTLAPNSPIGELESIEGKKFTLTTTLGSTSEYTVTAVKGPFISSFKFGKDTSGNSAKGITEDVVAAIDHSDNTIKLELLSTVTEELTTIQLTPTIEVQNGTVDPARATPHTFTGGSAKYTVTNSTDTSFTKEYNVTVTKKAASTE